MAVHLEAVSFEVADVPAVAAFWGALLGREPVTRADGSLLPGAPTQVGLRFVGSATSRVGPRRMHLHLTSADAEHQRRTIRSAVRLGGRHVRVDEGGFVVLADPGGDELCVIEPGNAFLAGAGPLGEVTCEGTRDVGVFWGRVLGWPLVWDQDGETAIQSPLGGTKLSWGGPPVPPRHGRNRERFDLVTDDVAREAERLVSLGATRSGPVVDGLALADPDGNELRLRAPSASSA